MAVRRSHLGALGQLPTVLHDEAVDAVVVLAQLSPRRAGWVVQVCADLGLSASIPLPWPQVPRLAPHVESGAGAHFLFFAPSTRRAAQMAVKQVLDLVLASAAVIVLAPVFIGIALAIALLDGPSRGLLAGARRPARPALPHAEVPDHAEGQRRAEGGPGSAQRSRRSGVQGDPRSARDPARRIPAPDQPGRTAAALPRPGRRHEPGRPAALARNRNSNASTARSAAACP